MQRIFQTKWLFVIICLSFNSGCGKKTMPANENLPHTPVHDAVIINSFPHDPGAFTQGLAYNDGFLYESTGLQGRSSLRKLALETGEVLKKVIPSRSVFAEGMTIRSNVVVQITWHAEQGYIYDLKSFDILNTFNYKGEGWGLCYDGNRYILSDGSSTLKFLSCDTFEVEYTREVTDQGVPLPLINELEYVENRLYANIWKSDKIACINPDTGEVEAWINCAHLRPDSPMKTEDVLNGIAYDQQGQRLFVTGKLWPVLYEIELPPSTGVLH